MTPWMTTVKGKGKVVRKTEPSVPSTVAQLSALSNMCVCVCGQVSRPSPLKKSRPEWLMRIRDTKRKTREMRCKRVDFVCVCVLIDGVVILNMGKSKMIQSRGLIKGLKQSGSSISNLRRPKACIMHWIKCGIIHLLF